MNSENKEKFAMLYAKQATDELASAFSNLMVIARRVAETIGHPHPDTWPSNVPPQALAVFAFTCGVVSAFVDKNPDGLTHIFKASIDTLHQECKSPAGECKYETALMELWQKSLENAGQLSDNEWPAELS